MFCQPNIFIRKAAAKAVSTVAYLTLPLQSKWNWMFTYHGGHKFVVNVHLMADTSLWRRFTYHGGHRFGSIFLYQLGTDQFDKLFESVHMVTHSKNCDRLQHAQNINEMMSAHPNWKSCHGGT